MQRRQWCFARGKFCGDDDVHRGQIVLRKTERLAHESSYTIAQNRIPRGLDRDREPNARMLQSVGNHTQPEESIVDSPAASVDRIELEFAAQTQLGSESKSTRGGLHGRPAPNQRPRQGTIFLRPLARRRARTF